MTANSEKGEKKVPLNSTVLPSQKTFLEKYRGDKGYDHISQATSDAINLLQNTTIGPAALKNEFQSRFGLVQVLYPANGHNYSALLEKADSLTLVFNDMRRWLDNHQHRDVLRNRINRNKPTKILLLHPKSNLMNFVARISNKLEIVDGKNRQVRDVERAVRRLCTGLWHKFGHRPNDEPENFQIVGHRYFNTYTMVMTEDECWVVWYPIFKRYNDGVIFCFQKNDEAEGLYKQFDADIKELERVSVDNHRDSDLIKLLSPREEKSPKNKRPKSANRTK